MSGLSAITTSGHPPFSNGTERYAWASAWCDWCVHDHAITHLGGDDSNEGGCELLIAMDVADYGQFRWPEAWLPEPDDGRFELPSRLVCGMFQPCDKGKCDGADPQAEVRAEVVVEVTAYWKDRAADLSRNQGETR